MCKIKCSECENETILTRENITEFAKYHGKTYHINCLLQKCKTNSRWKNQRQDIEENIDRYKQEWRDTFLEIVVKSEIADKKKAKAEKSKTSKAFLQRTCKCCKEVYTLNDDNYKDYVSHNKSSYHVDCFKDMINKNPRKYIWEINNYDLIKQQSDNNNKFVLDTDKVYQYIYNSYGITSLSSFAFMKFASVFNGSYKNIVKPLPPLDILEIWKRLKDETGYLAKSCAKKEFSSVEGEILYHLAIVVNNYDDYIKWKEKQQMLENTKNNGIENVNKAMNNEYIYKTFDKQRQAEKEENKNKGMNEYEEMLDSYWGIKY